MNFIWSILKLLYYSWRHGNSIPATNAVQSVIEPYRTGDYATALQAAENLRADGQLTAAYCFFRGSMLMHLGQLDDAERLLRESLTLPQEDRSRATAASSLGQILLIQNRFEEAKHCFADALSYWPDHGPFFRDLAEAWLHEGANLAEGLRFAQRAVYVDRTAEALSSEVYNLNLGEDLATLAWAVGLNARTGLISETHQVESLVAEAVETVGTSSASTLAQVHFYSGLALASVDRLHQAASHFERANEVDPAGHWGRSANSMATGLRA